MNPIAIGIIVLVLLIFIPMSVILLPNMSGGLFSAWGGWLELGVLDYSSSSPSLTGG